MRLAAAMPVPNRRTGIVTRRLMSTSSKENRTYTCGWPHKITGVNPCHDSIDGEQTDGHTPRRKRKLRRRPRARIQGRQERRPGKQRQFQKRSRTCGQSRKRRRTAKPSESLIPSRSIRTRILGRARPAHFIFHQIAHNIDYVKYEISITHDRSISNHLYAQPSVYCNS